MAYSDTVLKFENLALDGVVEPTNGKICRGEIVGIAGLDGHGQGEFIQLLCGLMAKTAGTIVFQPQDNPQIEVSDFKAAIDSGIAFVPRDRKADGVFSGLSVIDNFSITAIDRFSKSGIVRKQKLRDEYIRLADRLALVTASPDISIASLSGGNQQKVLIARWLATKPDLIILDDPTRGIDVATKRIIYGLLEELAAEGKAIILLSTDLTELTSVAHRTLIFRYGSIIEELTKAQTRPDSLLEGMFGQTPKEKQLG